MVDQFKNLMIGIFITAAAAIIIFILMFLHPNIGDKGKTLHARFVDVDKISIGTRVTYAGKPVGEVVAIEEIKDARAGKQDSLNHVYSYDVTLLVDSGINIFTTDQVSARTSGLLGEKNIEITPYAPEKGVALIPIDGTVIYAEETGSVEDTFKEFKTAADKFEMAMDSITDFMKTIKDHKLVDKVTHVVENVDDITTALNKPDQWNDIIINLDHLSKDFSNLMVKANKSWDTVDTTLASVNAAAADGAAVVAKVARGEGTVGRLLESDDLYLRTNSIFSKAETMMDDINHYGLLFQTDKGWQRLRARRMNLLAKLQSPQEFRNYFNDEVNQISTSISRVYSVLDAVENNPCCCNVMQDREFTKVFAELMRRVKMLEEEVRMYNTQAMELTVHQTELGCPPPLPCCWETNEYCPVEYYSQPECCIEQACNYQPE